MVGQGEEIVCLRFLEDVFSLSFNIPPPQMTFLQKYGVTKIVIDDTFLLEILWEFMELSA